MGVKHVDFPTLLSEAKITTTTRLIARCEIVIKSEEIPR